MAPCETALHAFLRPFSDQDHKIRDLWSFRSHAHKWLACPSPAIIRGAIDTREAHPVKYKTNEGFIEREVEINEEDLVEIIEDFLHDHAEFEFCEIEIVNNRPAIILLHDMCRTYIDPRRARSPANRGCRGAGVRRLR